MLKILIEEESNKLIVIIIFATKTPLLLYLSQIFSSYFSLLETLRPPTRRIEKSSIQYWIKKAAEAFVKNTLKSLRPSF